MKFVNEDIEVLYLDIDTRSYETKIRLERNFLGLG